MYPTPKRCPSLSTELLTGSDKSPHEIEIRQSASVHPLEIWITRGRSVRHGKKKNRPLGCWFLGSGHIYTSKEIREPVVGVDRTLAIGRSVLLQPELWLSHRCTSIYECCSLPKVVTLPYINIRPRMERSAFGSSKSSPVGYLGKLQGLASLYMVTSEIGALLAWAVVHVVYALVCFLL